MCFQKPIYNLDWTDSLVPLHWIVRSLLIHDGCIITVVSLVCRLLITRKRGLRLSNRGQIEAVSEKNTPYSERNRVSQLRTETQQLSWRNLVLVTHFSRAMPIGPCYRRTVCGTTGRIKHVCSVLILSFESI